MKGDKQRIQPLLEKSNFSKGDTHNKWNWIIMDESGKEVENIRKPL